MREYKVSLTWVLAIVAGSVLGASSLAALTPLGGQMQALAVTIAGDVVCSQCVGINGDGTNDIKDGSVTNAKLGTSAVTNSKIASSAVTNSKIGSSAVTSSKIATGGVANSDIAANAVTGDKIADGTIGYADVSRAFIVEEHRDDCNCGGTGWDPDSTTDFEAIFDDRITINSVVSVSIIPNTLACWATAGDGRAFVTCDQNIPNGLGINYSIIRNPAYG